jgi:hypothetical protein
LKPFDYLGLKKIFKKSHKFFCWWYKENKFSTKFF